MVAEKVPTRGMSVRLDPETHRRLRIVLAKEEKTLQSLFEDYVKRYLEAKGG